MKLTICPIQFILTGAMILIRYEDIVKICKNFSVEVWSSDTMFGFVSTMTSNSLSELL